MLFDLDKCLKAWEEDKIQKKFLNDFRVVCDDFITDCFKI